MSVPARRVPTVLLAGAAALLVAGCAGGAEDSVEAVTEPEVTVPSGAPGPDRCVALPSAPDGVYRVEGAGTATVLDRGDRLEAVDHRGADGWVSRVDDTAPVDVEIEYRRGFEAVQLEVERTASGIDARVCGED